MSEGSLPPFKLRLLRSSVRRTWSRLFGFLRHREEGRSAKTAAPVEIEAAVQAHAESHAALFERADRLRTKAERLESEGTPSESARNRARRAEEEVEAGLRDLRASHMAGGGEGRDFDREVSRRYPRLRISGE